MQSVAKLGDLAGTGVGGTFVGFQDALGRCDSLNLNNFDAAGGLLWFSEIIFLKEPKFPLVADRSVLSKSFLLASGGRRNGCVLRAGCAPSLRVRILRVRRILNEVIDSTGR